jgi:uncharacterized protein with WD repeat
VNKGKGIHIQLINAVITENMEDLSSKKEKPSSMKIHCLSPSTPATLIFLAADHAELASWITSLNESKAEALKASEF